MNDFGISKIMSESSSSKELGANITIATLALIHIFVFVPNTVAWTVYDLASDDFLNFGELKYKFIIKTQARELEFAIVLLYFLKTTLCI